MKISFAPNGPPFPYSSTIIANTLLQDTWNHLSYSEDIDKEQEAQQADGGIGGQNTAGSVRWSAVRRQKAANAGPVKEMHTWVRFRRKRKASTATAEALAKVWAQAGRLLLLEIPPPLTPPTAVTLRNSFFLYLVTVLSLDMSILQNAGGG